jgi:hypothetical protein
MSWGLRREWSIDVNQYLDWVSRHASSVILCLAGALFVALAVWVVPDRQAVATALVAFGAGAIVLGAVLPRLEGEFSIGPEGLKAILKAVTRRGRDQGLPNEQVDAAAERAIEMVYGKAVGRAHVWSRAVGHATDAIISAPVADAIADAAIAEVAAEESSPTDGS